MVGDRWLLFCLSGVSPRVVSLWVVRASAAEQSRCELGLTLYHGGDHYKVHCELWEADILATATSRAPARLCAAVCI